MDTEDTVASGAGVLPPNRSPAQAATGSTDKFLTEARFVSTNLSLQW